MESRVNYALVGAFVLLLGSAAIAILLWLVAGGPRVSYTHYLVYTTDSVAGLPADAPVRYHGVKVGYVSTIGLDPDNPQRVRLLLNIAQGTPIKQDTRATLQMQGITGINYISLSGGANSSPPLTATPGKPYPVIKSGTSLLQRADVILTQVGENVSSLSKRINAVLSTDNLRHLSATLAHLDTITGALAANSSRINQSLQEFDFTLRDLRDSTAKLPILLDNANRSAVLLPTLIHNLNRSSKNFNSAAAQVNAAAISVQRALPQLDLTMQELSNTATTYRHLGEQLQRNPGALLYGPTPVKPGPGE
ncbi:MlaD family protein [Acidihalobacter ferrooxydans]|uniref:Mce/MlaD domain-containing protein n=1 Tax=Acidihalobacter ferrooxydans TaxID=1765967 RepID=A0A1P8UHR0_9GAMM|nr:MlaD family protein [Acidihalobacter ferrooxydans]APZ43357.1 hypothetical protein BW247_09850 [Acidihalobacter ferrooxydans]